jgi:putative aminopeptidase FrvX
MSLPTSFLRQLLDTPGPSGFETSPARIWRAEAEKIADRVDVDVTGNSTATINPDGNPAVMLAGHIDEIGLMIVHVDDEGYLFFQTIGGWDTQVLVGQRVLIAGREGPVTGVIGKNAIHLMKEEDREKVSETTDLWIDIGASNKEAALERIRLGDAAVIDASAKDLPGNRLVSRSIDNRIGAFVVLETLRQLAEDRPVARVSAVATAQEEIGYTGGGARPLASAMAPAVAIAVDVTHATDYPGVEKKEAGDFKLGGGPILTRGSTTNPVLFEFLSDIATREEIPFGISAAPRDTGTDADSIHNAHHGIATGVVSIPNRYMHSPNEMIDLADVEATIRLLVAFSRALTPETDFIPR